MRKKLRSLAAAQATILAIAFSPRVPWPSPKVGRISYKIWTPSSQTPSATDIYLGGPSQNSSLALCGNDRYTTSLSEQPILLPNEESQAITVKEYYIPPIYTSSTISIKLIRYRYGISGLRWNEMAWSDAVWPSKMRR